MADYALSLDSELSFGQTLGSDAGLGFHPSQLLIFSQELRINYEPKLDMVQTLPFEHAWRRAWEMGISDNFSLSQSMFNPVLGINSLLAFSDLIEAEANKAWENELEFDDEMLFGWTQKILDLSHTLDFKDSFIGYIE